MLNNQRNVTVALFMFVCSAIGLAASPGAEWTWDKNDPMKKMLLTDDPLIVPIRMSPETRDKIAKILEKDTEFDVRLEISGVVPGPNFGQLKAVRFFLNLPAASLKTSIEDPHYAGSIAIAKVLPKSEKETSGYLVSLTKTLRTLQKANELWLDQPIVITVVAVPEKGAVIKPNVAFLEFGGLTVTATNSK
jgi:hypothetical protein